MDFYVLFRNGNQSPPPLLAPLFYPPPFCSNGRAQMLCCLSLCFSTYEESPAQNSMPLGRKRCFCVVVSFAAIGGMGVGALIRQLWLYQDGSTKKAFYLGHVQWSSWHSATLPIQERFSGMCYVCLYKWLPGSPTGWSRGTADNAMHGCTV